MTLGQKFQFVITLAGFTGLFGWLAFRALRNTDEPVTLALKWGVTLAFLGGMVWLLHNVATGRLNPIVGLLGMIVSALPLGVIWAPSIGGLIVSPLVGLYTGNEEVVAAANYSLAHGRRKRGEIPEALAQVHAQLERFPNDHAGVLLLAAIQAEDLKDLAAAEETILTYVHTVRPEAPKTAAALHALADFHLKYARNPEAARECLEKIIQLHPDTGHSTMAAQRIAHLASPEHLEALRAPQLIGVKHIPIKVGLHTPAPVTGEQEAIAAEEEIVRCQATLEAHPLDFDTREHLASLLVEHHQALDEAHREIEFMLRQPTATPRQIKRWLNLQVDLDAKYGTYSPQSEEALKRLVSLFPGSAAAEAAQSRLTNLKSEFRRKAPGQTYRIGAYEKDLGLRE